MDATGYLVLGTVALAIVGYFIYEWFVRPNLSSFKNEHVHIWRDPHMPVMHIDSSNDIQSHTLKFNCGAFKVDKLTREVTRTKWHSGTAGSVNLYGTGSGFVTGSVTRGTEGWFETITETQLTGFTTISVRELNPEAHYFKDWASGYDDHTSPDTSEHIVDLHLTNRAGRALQRWLSAHRKELEPDYKALRKKWGKLTKALLSEARSKAFGAKAIEVHQFDSTPSLRYLAIGKDGTAFAKAYRGAVTCVDFSEMQTTDTALTVTLPGHTKQVFQLQPAQIAALHKIRRHREKRKKPAYG